MHLGQRQEPSAFIQLFCLGISSSSAQGEDRPRKHMDLTMRSPLKSNGLAPPIYDPNVYLVGLKHKLARFFVSEKPEKLRFLHRTSSKLL